MESREKGGVGEHYLHGAICNRGVQHLGLTHPAMKAKRAWISNAANQPGRSAELSAAGGLGQMRMNAKKKRKDPPRNNRHQGVGDAGRESCDHRQGRRLLVERLNLLA
jgi:hypothetical protein